VCQSLHHRSPLLQCVLDYTSFFFFFCIVFARACVITPEGALQGQRVKKICIYAAPAGRRVDRPDSGDNKCTHMVHAALHQDYYMYNNKIK
jgi:hypothetical protein